MVPTTLVEAEPVLDILNEDNDGWTLVTRRRPKKQRPIQPPPFRWRKRQGIKKNPQCPKGKKKHNSDRKHKVQPVDLLEQEPLLPVTLEEFFPRDFFKKVAVNMASCSELEDKDGKKMYRQMFKKLPFQVQTTKSSLSWKFHQSAWVGNKSSTCQKRCANRLWMPCTMQSCMLIKWKQSKNLQSFQLNMLLATWRCHLQMKIYCLGPSPQSSLVCHWLYQGTEKFSQETCRCKQ